MIGAPIRSIRESDVARGDGYARSWVLSRYDDCWAAMRDPRLGKRYASQIEQRFGPGWRHHQSLTSGEHSMLNTGGPEHTRLRKLVTKAFAPRHPTQAAPAEPRRSLLFFGAPPATTFAVELPALAPGLACAPPPP